MVLCRILENMLEEVNIKKPMKQAGAELSQAQDSIEMPIFRYFVFICELPKINKELN